MAAIRTEDSPAVQQGAGWAGRNDWAGRDSRQQSATAGRRQHDSDGYYVAYKPITLSLILFMFVEMKFIHCHSCVTFAMKSMSMCND